jgi:hypothetical protein
VADIGLIEHRSELKTLFSKVINDIVRPDDAAARLGTGGDRQ